MFAPLLSLFNRLVQRHLLLIHRLATRRPLPVIITASMLFVASLTLISSTRFETDVFTLFPARSPAVQLFLDSLKWSSGSGKIYFLLEGDKTLLLTEGDRFAAQLEKLELQGAPAFRRVSHRIYQGEEGPAFASFLRYAAMHPGSFISPNAVDDYLDRLRPEGMKKGLKRARTEIAMQPGAAGREIVAADPLFFRDLILPRFKESVEAFDLDPASPYFLSRDGRLLIIIAEPARPVNDMAFARELVAAIEMLREASKVDIACAGAHFSAVEDEAAMSATIRGCIASSLAVVLLLFYVAYRRLLPTLLLPLILLFATVLSLGCVAALFSSIHILSIAFTAMIIGLGTDYSIHLYDRFISERVAGKSAVDAAEIAAVDTGHGLFTAAMTTALPFFAFMLSDVKGLFELGFLVALGVIFSLYATLLFLPPLLLFMDRRFPAKKSVAPLTFGLGRAWGIPTRFPYTVITLAILVTIASLAVLPNLRFERDLKNLQPKNSEAFLAQKKMEQHLLRAPQELLVAVDGRSLAEVISRGEHVQEIIESFAGRGEIAAYSSLLGVVNGPRAQQIVNAALNRSLANRDVGADLKRGLTAEGFAEEPFQELLKGIGKVGPAGPRQFEEAVAALAASPLGAVSDRHLVKDASGAHLLFYVQYHAGKLDGERFFREVGEGGAVRITSPEMVTREIGSGVKKSLLLSVLVGGTLVLLLVTVHFVSLRGLGYTLVPVFFGVVVMLGIMAAMGEKINFMNAMVIITVIGMGSDYGLHLAHRLESSFSEGGYIQAGRAVLLSALTTIAGFGSLAFAGFPGLASMGTATLLGVGCTAMFALLPLLAVMYILRRSR